MSTRYLTPFFFLGLVPLGALLGGYWTFGAAAATMLCMPGLDLVFGEHDSRGSAANAFTRWLPRIYIVAQLAISAWMAAIVSRPGTGTVDVLGLAVSDGITTGVFGFVAAHEMIHSRDARLRSLGLAMLATSFYMQFSIAHLTGHHRLAATHDDPSSARLGEGLYAFILRSAAGQFREAWTFETSRMRRQGRPRFGINNRMTVYLAVEAALIIALGVIGWRVLGFVVLVAVIAVALLETFNYVAHYGLRRRVGPDGKIERLGPNHSWNSRRRVDRAALLNMGCHSAHHDRPSRSFEQLRVQPGSAKLPFGYGTAILTALVPPLWKQIMNKRAVGSMTMSLEHSTAASG